VIGFTLSTITSGIASERGTTITRQRRLFLASLIVAWVALIPACSGGRQAGRGPDENLIAYEVLKKTTRADGKIIMVVLVDEKTSKQDILKLAE
jgi:hypothetical protein